MNALASSGCAYDPVDSTVEDEDRSVKNITIDRHRSSQPNGC